MARQRKAYSRTNRIAEQIRRELADITQQHLKDPRAGWITITAVEVTRDYSHAKIFYTVMPDDLKNSTHEVLDHSTGFLRSELGRRLSTYTTPQLHFLYDESIERGLRMNQLIDQTLCTSMPEAYESKSD